MATDDLSALIRVRKHAVEQKQKELAKLYRLLEALNTQKQKLQDQLAAEQAQSDPNDINMMRYLQNFVQATQASIDDITHDQGVLNQKIDAMREDIRALFAALKKIEITAERRADKALNALEKKEAQIYDDIAIEGFRKNKEDAG